MVPAGERVAMYEGEQSLAPLRVRDYLGYTVLYLVPFVGFFFLIAFSFSEANTNRRNFTRAFFTVYAIVVVALMWLYFSGTFNRIVQYAANALA